MVMCVGGCTWQWLQRAVQQPIDQGSLLAPSVSQQPQDPSHAHANHMLSQHIKHTRRLLRLFRHALSKQALLTPGASSAMYGSELPAQMPAAAPTTWNPTSRELAASSHTASSAAAASNCAPSISCQSAAAADSAAAPASSGAASAAVTDSTADHAMSASAQAEDSSVAAGRDSSSVPHSASIKAALMLEAKPSAHTTILVEAIIPDQQLCTNSCHTPWLWNFSIAPQTLASHCSCGTLQTTASTAVPEGMDAQRHMAEQLVQQHIQSCEFGWNGKAPIQLSSSIKVSPL